MPTTLPAGPYRSIRLDDGTEVPYYIIPFDKKGRCEGPETRTHLIDAVSRGTFTDIYLFSHGWNNDWTVATQRYESFIHGFMTMRRTHGLSFTQPYRPLLVGIFWPSTALVFGEGEVGPEIAAGDPGAIDKAVAAERQAASDVADQLADKDVERFYALAQKDGLTPGEARELANIVRPLYAGADSEGSDEQAPTPEEIVEVWRAGMEQPDDLTSIGVVGGGDSAEAQAAGFTDVLSRLDPRQLVRLLTVRQMKDRAGTVGATGVGPLLRELLAAQTDTSAGAPARINLIGHSYGAKVVLSAMCVGAPLARRVHSVLLLQPAVSHLCFAEQVPGTSRAGGYRQALDLVERPILSTFSAHDLPLTKMFHLALRRSSDLGEARIAAAGDPPSVYAALGGFGPRSAGEQLVDIKDVSQPYPLKDGTRLYGLRGTRTIAGHGDVSNESTWWALYSLASV